jgi:hypothetical protein
MPMAERADRYGWLVRQAGRDVAEGAALALIDAKREAERVVLTLVRLVGERNVVFLAK